MHTHASQSSILSKCQMLDCGWTSEVGPQEGQEDLDTIYNIPFSKENKEPQDFLIVSGNVVKATAWLNYLEKWKRCNRSNC